MTTSRPCCSAGTNGIGGAGTTFAVVHSPFPAATADRPEQIRMGLRVDLDDLAVRGHDLGSEQVIDRESVRTAQVPDAAPQRQPADADRAGVAEPCRKAMRGRGLS